MANNSWKLPDRVVQRIAEGVPLLKAMREWRGLTAYELSEQAEVQLVILMLAERGGDLLPEEARAIARVLGIDAERLIEALHRVALTAPYVESHDEPAPQQDR